MTLAIKRHRFTVDQYHRMGEAGILAEDVLLVIEVVETTLRLDRRVKIPLYARAGIREAWVVDLTAARVEVHRQPAARGYRNVQGLTRSASVVPVAFPDLTIDLVDVLG
jgi:Uma2 family endonuclease